MIKTIEVTNASFMLSFALNTKLEIVQQRETFLFTKLNL